VIALTLTLNWQLVVAIACVSALFAVCAWATTKI
jgi:hypothetical protein